MENEKTGSKVDTSKAGNLSNLSKLKTASDSDNGNEVKVSKRELSTEEFETYCKILADGKPHTIQDLLTKFDLPRTNAGREKLRKANNKINQTDGFGLVVPVYPEGVTGKCFQLQVSN